MTHPAQTAKPTTACIPATEDVEAWEDRFGETPFLAQTKAEREEDFRRRQEHRQMKRRILRQFDRRR